MPIPVINYAAMQSQGNPLWASILPAIMQGLKLGATPKAISQESQGNDLKNALLAIQKQYQPQLNESEIAQRGAQTNLLGEQAKYFGPNIESEMAQRGAQTNLLGQQSKFMPLSYLLKASGEMRSNSRFGAAYQLSTWLKTLSEPSRLKWIAEHQQEFNDMLSDMGDKVQQEKETAGNDVLQAELKKLFPNSSFAINPQQQSQLVAAGRATPGNAPTIQSNMPNLPVNDAIKRAFSTTPEQTQKMADLNILAANNSLITNATQEQKEGAIQIDRVMDDPEFRKRAIAASKYAGIMGKGKEALAAFSQTNPEEYENALSFMNNDVVLLKNRIKSVDRMGATDSQREELDHMFEDMMHSWTTNPKQFITQLDNLGAAIDNISRGVVASSTPAGPDNRFNPYRKIGNEMKQRGAGSKPALSQQQLEYTAKKYGISIDQVKQQLGGG